MVVTKGFNPMGENGWPEHKRLVESRLKNLETSLYELETKQSVKYDKIIEKISDLDKRLSILDSKFFIYLGGGLGGGGLLWFFLSWLLNHL